MEGKNQPTIIFEDDALLVLNKPAGITVNNSDTTAGEKTVQDWLKEQFSIYNVQFTNEQEADFYSRAGIAHRLDKETSGILLVAKTPQTFIELQRQFKERIVKKTYRALAHGRIVPEEGIISVPVGRLPWNRKQFGVVAGGREALTRYRVISNFQYPISKKDNEILSLVELYPETGRTHQIRVHLKHINHPIFADFLYAGRKTARNDRQILSRVFLHAANISFLHPTTKKTVSFESQLPPALQQVLDTFSVIHLIA